MKKKKVCEGCVYRYQYKGATAVNGTCNYMEMTGHSRILVERANGGGKK